MGIRRLGRKRLAAIESHGIRKDISPSAAMKNAIVSADQHREGHKVVTDIVLDLGAANAGLKTKALADKDPIGTTAASTAPSYVCQVTDAVFGTVTSVEVICLEAITDGTLTDYDVMFGDDDGYLGSDASNDTAIKTGVGAKGYHEIAEYDAENLKNKYIYITAGAATTQVATATISTADATITNMVSGSTTIRLKDSSGAAVNFVAGAGNHDAAGADGIIKIQGMASKADLAQAISRGINANAAFSTDAASRGGSSETVTVEHAAVTATNNQTNYLINDDPEASTGISVGAFTGGIDDGVAISGGKLLLRFTGFMEPDDI